VSTLAKEKSSWETRGERIVSQAMELPWRAALTVLGCALRREDTNESRAKAAKEAIKKKIRQLMLSHNVDEYAASNTTFIQLTQSRATKKGDKGREQKVRVADLLGMELADKLISEQEIVIPAVTEIVFTVDEDELEKLSQEEKKLFYQALGNTPSVCLSREVPKRFKLGEPRK